MKLSVRDFVIDSLTKFYNKSPWKFGNSYRNILMNNSNSEATGDYSVAMGNHTTALNLSELAFGQFNLSHKNSSTFGDSKNTALSVGVGTALTAQNALEITQNADIYVKGVGNYDGTTLKESNNNVKTLLEVINSAGSDFEYTNDMAMPATVGGFAAGTTFDGKTLQEMFDGLLYPYVAPTASISANPNKFEYDNRNGGGTTITFTLTQNTGSDPITSYSLDGIANTTQVTKTGTTSNVTVNGSVSDGTTTINGNNLKATSLVAWKFYLGFAADAATAKTNFENITANNSNLYTSVSSIGTKSATNSEAVLKDLYLIINNSWWTDGYTLQSSVGAVTPANIILRDYNWKGTNYMVALVGSYNLGTQTFRIQ